MATNEVKMREARGEDLSGIIWTAEKPFMLIRRVDDHAAVQFLTCRSDFDYAVKKAERNGEEILYAANVLCFQKIDDFKSGFGRNTETLPEAWLKK